MNQNKNYSILCDIPSYYKWIKIEEINKGWSKDRKFYVVDNKDEKLLLRVSDFSFYEFKKKEFESMKDVYNLGINMSKPIEFGICVFHLHKDRLMDILKIIFQKIFLKCYLCM